MFNEKNNNRANETTETVRGRRRRVALYWTTRAPRGPRARRTGVTVSKTSDVAGSVRHTLQPIRRDFFPSDSVRFRPNTPDRRTFGFAFYNRGSVSRFTSNRTTRRNNVEKHI